MSLVPTLMLSALAEYDCDVIAPETTGVYVLGVDPGHEFEADKHLRYRGIESFFPTYRAIRRFPDRRPISISKALFPGYMFAELRRSEMQLAVTSPHVHEPISFGGIAVLMSTDEMARIRAMGAMDGVEPWERLACGERVRITDGPLAGASGRVIQRKGQLQIAVEIEILNRAVKVVVDGWTVAPC